MKSDSPLAKDSWNRPTTVGEIAQQGKALDVQVGGDHYKSFKIQPAEFCAKNNIPFLEGNVIKYITRHLYKNGIEDLNKARHYIDLIEELHYGRDS